MIAAFSWVHVHAVRMFMKGGINMPMLRTRLFGLFLALTVIGLGAGMATAQTPYAPPAISLVDRGLFRLTLEIDAGANGTPAGFEIQWMKKSDYDALGGTWPDQGHPALK